MKHKINIAFDSSQSSLSAGLRINWFSGSDDKTEIDLTCGAGVGSPYMTFTMKDKKTKKWVSATADIRTIVDQLTEAMRKELAKELAKKKGQP